MEQIRNFEEAHEVLKTYISQTSQREVYTLNGMTTLMEKLGNPQEKYKVIHIAGTSGKTSTAYYVSSMLKAYGLKVGLTVSPHVDEVNERIQIGLEPLPEKIFCSNLTQFINLVEKTGIKPTYFELLVAFAYWYFAKVAVDYAVVEVGLGGLLDGTNVVNRQDKTCVITDIGYDHVSVLGETIEAIATQKAGIIRPYNTVFAYEQGSEVMTVLREVADQQQAELHEILPMKAEELLKELPLFQRRNWYLAKEAVQYIAERDGLDTLTQEQLAKSAQTYIPARMETCQYHDKTLIMDGSHNAQKIHALVGGLKQKFPKTHMSVLIGLLEEKDVHVKQILQELKSLTAHLVVTSFFAGQDIPKKPLNPETIAKAAKDMGFDSVEVIVDAPTALRSLLDRPEKHMLVTGSFYLLNHIRPLVKHDTVNV